jgi:hypothetical protein
MLRAVLRAPQQSVETGKPICATNVPPIFAQQLAANQAQTKVDAARMQLEAKAQNTNYVSDVDMSASSFI